MAAAAGAFTLREPSTVATVLSCLRALSLHSLVWMSTELRVDGMDLTLMMYPKQRGTDSMRRRFDYRTASASPPGDAELGFVAHQQVGFLDRGCGVGHTHWSWRRCPLLSVWFPDGELPWIHRMPRGLAPETR